jgi:ABC transporter/Branched-chain amino acid transport system / permease component
MTQEQLVQQMVGRKVEQLYTRSRRAPGEVVLEVRGFSRPPGFRDVSFQVREGEIVGLAGLVGSGRSEIARAIFGVDRGATGDVIWRGQPLAADPWSNLRRGVSDTFLTVDNLLNATRFTTEIGLVALGMTLVMITGGIDLSVGSVIALTAVVVGMLIQAGVGAWLAALLGLVLGGLLGALRPNISKAA